MEEESTNAHISPGRLATRIVGTLIVLFLLYALSYGPLYVMSLKTGHPSQSTVFAFHEPLWLLAEMTSTTELLDTYLDWCVERFVPIESRP